MNVKFSPGPWEARQSFNGYWFIDHQQGDEGYTLTKLDCGEADALLIASAPELFACLKQVLDSHGELDDALWNRIRNAVADASGNAA